MQTNPDKRVSGNCGSVHKEDEMNEEDPTQGIPDRLQPFTENLEDMETHVPANPSDGEISDSEGDASKVVIQTRKHSIFSHFPKHRNCKICLRTKIMRVPCKRRNEGSIPWAEEFGDLITADHKVLNEGSEFRNNHRFAVVVQDLATQWMQFFRVKTKTSQETDSSLRKFLELSGKPKVIYTVNSLEFGKAFEPLSWVHCTSTPLRSETNRYAELKMELLLGCCNLVWTKSGGRIPWNGTVTREMFKTSHRVIDDRISSFLCERPSRLHQFGKKLLPGIFLEYELYAGGIWKGNILVADTEELENLDTSEIYARRVDAKEVITPKNGENFILPIHLNTGSTRERRRAQR